MLKFTVLHTPNSRLSFAMSRVFLFTALAALSGVVISRSATALPITAAPPTLIATAYTDLTLPTLQRGDRGENVRLLQQILSDNGFLGAAGVRLGNPSGAIVDGVFGPVTESAVRDLQQRYNERSSLAITGRVNPATWEVLDMYENPYRSPLPWKQ